MYSLIWNIFRAQNPSSLRRSSFVTDLRVFRSHWHDFRYYHPLGWPVFAISVAAFLIDDGSCSTQINDLDHSNSLDCGSSHTHLDSHHRLYIWPLPGPHTIPYLRRLLLSLLHYLRLARRNSVRAIFPFRSSCFVVNCYSIQFISQSGIGSPETRAPQGQSLLLPHPAHPHCLFHCFQLDKPQRKPGCRGGLMASIPSSRCLLLWALEPAFLFPRCPS